MVYYTQYTLEVDDQKPLDDCEDWLDDFEIARDLIYTGYHDQCKWYDNEKDMIELSKKFPTVMFTLTGVGEEITMQDCDVWIKTFKGGKMIRHQKGEIVFKDV